MSEKQRNEIIEQNDRAWKAWCESWDKIIYKKAKKVKTKQQNPNFTYESTLKFLQEYYPEIKWTKSENCFNTITEPNKITIGIYSNVWLVSYGYSQFQNYQTTTTQELIDAITKVQQGKIPTV